MIKSPGFALAGVIILGLGIGVNSAIFTLVNAVILKPLPFADADRIMSLLQTPPPTLFTDEVFPVSPANFIDYAEQNQVFEKVAIYRTGRQTLTGHGEPEPVIALRGSADFLPILGIQPSVGRGFTTDDDSAGGQPSVLLSDAFFKSHFGGDPAIVGQTITLNRVAHTVIGVVPPITSFIQRAQVWVPLAWTAKDRAIRNNHNYLGDCEAEGRRGCRPRSVGPRCDLDTPRGRVSGRQQGLGRGGAAVARPTWCATCGPRCWCCSAPWRSCC